LDNPDEKRSILSVQVPKFDEQGQVKMTKSIDTFPFPYYLILRDINHLPDVLADALRQWFELLKQH